MDVMKCVTFFSPKTDGELTEVRFGWTEHAARKVD
jgi:hypothetical protein